MCIRDSKEGFLRSETSLIQTIGRAARNADGLVIMYADEITPSMRAAIDETERRRSIQDAYNQEHGIVPKTIIKGVREILEISKTAEEDTLRAHKKRKLTEQEREMCIRDRGCPPGPTAGGGSRRSPSPCPRWTGGSCWWSSGQWRWRG